MKLIFNYISLLSLFDLLLFERKEILNYLLASKVVTVFINLNGPFAEYGHMISHGTKNILLVSKQRRRARKINRLRHSKG